MAAYKQFNSEDIIVSPLEVNKSFTFSGEGTLVKPNIGIDRFLANDTSHLFTTGYIQTRLQSSIYHSVKQSLAPLRVSMPIDLIINSNDEEIKNEICY